jgi:phosphodiesterase/alkaline phosphatase D-like protein
MNTLLRALALATMGTTLLCANYGAAQTAQIPAPAKRPERVEITKGPDLEITNDQFTIIRWNTNNPGGADVHYGIVQYGTDPNDLSRTAKSPIRINRAHTHTTFRVRITGLKPQTTYYYRVTSEDSTGTSDSVKSTVSKFTTPAPGERIVAYPPQPVPSPK